MWRVSLVPVLCGKPAFSGDISFTRLAARHDGGKGQKAIQASPCGPGRILGEGLPMRTGSRDATLAPRANSELLSCQEATIQRCGRGSEQQGQPTMPTPSVPSMSRNRLVSCTRQTAVRCSYSRRTALVRSFLAPRCLRKANILSSDASIWARPIRMRRTRRCGYAASASLSRPRTGRNGAAP